MATKRFIVEMDEVLATVLKNSGQIKIVEAPITKAVNMHPHSTPDDGRGSIKWIVTAGNRTEYEGWSKDRAMATYSKFLAYSRNDSENHPAFNKPVKILKDGKVHMEHVPK
jgi:hypothetical protein